MNPSNHLNEDEVIPDYPDNNENGESGDSGDEDEDESDAPLDGETESEDEEEEGANGNNEPMEMMNLKFLGLTPTDPDQDGIENLCKQLFKHWNIDVKALAGLLVEQNYVSTVLKDDVDEEDAARMEQEDPFDGGTVYGIYSMINFKVKKDNAAMKQIIDWIITKEAEKNDGTVFKEILDLDENNNPHTPGLLIKEKIVNIPGVACGPFMRQLMKDQQAALQKGMQYDFTHYVHVAKLLHIVNQDDFFVDQDDEMMHVHSARFFDVDYPASIDSKVVFQNDKGNDIQGTAFRRIYLIPKEGMMAYMQELESLPSVLDVIQEAEQSGL